MTRREEDERGERTGPADPDGYAVAAGPGRGELKVQRSLFLAEAAPAPDEAAARAHLAEAARRHHDSRHVAHAWRLGAGPSLREARGDGGEPSGTAGEPILAAIRAAGLTDTVVTVARWFGGVKLGTGGLARAYGEAAAQALAQAPRRAVRLGTVFALEFPYARQGTLAHLLEACEGRLLGQEFAAGVRWRVWVPRRQAERFARDSVERTAAEARLERLREDEAGP